MQPRSDLISIETPTSVNKMTETRRLERGHYKVCLTGPSGVGKTSIFNAIRGKEFEKFPRQETDIYKLNLSVKNKNGQKVDIVLEVWDTAGMEERASLTDNYYRDAKAIITVFSIASQRSFKGVYEEIGRIRKEDYSPDALFFLVGNKIDLKEEQVPKAQIDDCLLSHQGTFVNYTRTSAKNGTNIDELFQSVGFNLVFKEVRPVMEKNDLKNIYNPKKKCSCKS